MAGAMKLSKLGLWPPTIQLLPTLDAERTPTHAEGLNKIESSGCREANTQAAYCYRLGLGF
jgi:hypothetical protein